MLASAVAYLCLSHLMFTRFWNGDGVGVIRVFTTPARGRIAASAERMKAAAWAVGTPPSAFQMRQTSILYDLLWQRWRLNNSGGAAYAWGYGIIIADTYWISDMSDAELDCVMAHEIGHVIQYDARSEAARPTLELLADRTAARLCGPDAWNAFFAKYIGARRPIDGPGSRGRSFLGCHKQ